MGNTSSVMGGLLRVIISVNLTCQKVPELQVVRERLVFGDYLDVSLVSVAAVLTVFSIGTIFGLDHNKLAACSQEVVVQPKRTIVLQSPYIS